MWKRRKSNADGDAPAKKYQKKSYGNESNDNDAESVVVCEIAHNKRVSVRSFNGKVMVDIRETYVNDAGEKCPGKKGMCVGLLFDFSILLRCLMSRVYLGPCLMSRVY
ncbi:hypothetical protein AgCh_013693 [Apium graveolens]